MLLFYHHNTYIKNVCYYVNKTNRISNINVKEFVQEGKFITYNENKLLDCDFYYENIVNLNVEMPKASRQYFTCRL